MKNTNVVTMQNEKKNPVNRMSKMKNSNTLIKDIEREIAYKGAQYKVTPVSEMTSKVNGALQKNLVINSNNFVEFYSKHVDNRYNIFHVPITEKSLYSVADVGILLTSLIQYIDMQKFTPKHVEEYIPGINNLFLRNELLRYIQGYINIPMDSYYNGLFRKNIKMNALILWESPKPQIFSVDITLKKIKISLGGHTKQVSDSLYKFVIAMAKRRKPNGSHIMIRERLYKYFPMPALPTVNKEDAGKNILWSDREFFFYLANIFLVEKKVT